MTTKMTRGFFAILSSIIWMHTIVAQVPGQGVPPLPKELSGTILEAQSREPVEFATITVVKPENDSIISAILSDEKGQFLIEIPGRFRNVRLEVTFIGFKSIDNIVELNRGSTKVELGQLLLELDEQMLEEVLVTAEQSNMNLYVDRKVYNVDKDLSARGGTGEDVMKNLPGVDVDADGNVSVRNAGAQIFIDGRPTTLELDKIPADQIEAVEVITNPSVKFDASSSGGIINIRMKKNRKAGYNGSASLGIGTTDRYSAMANLNVNKGPINLSGNYSFNRVGNNIDTYVNRQSFVNGETSELFNQDNSLYNTRIFHSGRITMDYQASKRDLFSVGGNFSNGNFGSAESQEFQSTSPSGAIFYTGDQLQDNNFRFNNYTAQGYYSRRFDKPGREFTVDLNYNRSSRDGINLLNTRNYDADGILIGGREIRQNLSTIGETDMITFQLDYVTPVGNNSRFETGARIMYKTSDFENIVGRFDDVNNVFIPDSILSNQFEILEQVNAAYVNYISSWKGINYQAGVRFEHSLYEGEILGSETRFSYEYPSAGTNIFNALFPAIYLSRKYKDNTEWQFNVSRKIGRPGFWHISPRVNINDPRNIRLGNPDLRPEFINLAELNHNIQRNKISWLSTIYGRLTQDPITQVVFPFEGDSSVLVSTSINGEIDFSYGWENIWKYSPVRNIDITLSVNAYMINVRSSTPEGVFENSGFTYNIKPMINYRLPEDFALQISGSYQAPRIIPQGQTIPFYFLDVSLNKKIGKSWNINLVFSDVFNTKFWGQQFDTPFYFQEATRRREARFARLTATYSFGKNDLPRFRKRNGRDEGGRGGMDDGEF
jgi:hypothetical protein